MYHHVEWPWPGGVAAASWPAESLSQQEPADRPQPGPGQHRPGRPRPPLHQPAWWARERTPLKASMDFQMCEICTCHVAPKYVLHLEHLLYCIQSKIRGIFKGTLAWDFSFHLVCSKEPIRANDLSPEIFSFLVANSPIYLTFCAFHVFSVSGQICFTYSQYIHWISPMYSLYSQYTYNCAMCISICIVLMLSKNITNAIYFQNKSNLPLHIHTTVFVQFHSVYSQYKLNFIPHVQRRRLNELVFL